MGQFYNRVDLDNRDEMVDYLVSHYKYYTMNSWNGSYGYAHNVKVDRLKGLTDLGRGIAYEALFGEIDEFDNPIMETVNHHVRYYDSTHDFTSIGFNGRSGGYIVLYRAEINHRPYFKEPFKETDSMEARRYCGRYERWFTKAEAIERDIIDKFYKDKSVFPGRDTVYNEEEIESWDDDYLRENVKEILEFDKTVQQIVDDFIEMCNNGVVVEEEVEETRMVKHRYIEERVEEQS